MYGQVNGSGSIRFRFKPILVPSGSIQFRFCQVPFNGSGRESRKGNNRFQGLVRFRDSGCQKSPRAPSGYQAANQRVSSIML